MIRFRFFSTIPFCCALRRSSLQLLSSNYPTKSALLFHSDKDLFGHEGHHRVEIAHVFDRFEIDLDWVGVVARNGWQSALAFRARSRAVALLLSRFRSRRNFHRLWTVCYDRRVPEVDKSDENRTRIAMTGELNSALLLLARQFRGASQADVALTAGLNQGHYSRIENGLVPEGPSVDSVERIAAALKFPVGFFYQDDGLTEPSAECASL